MLYIRQQVVLNNNMDLRKRSQDIRQILSDALHIHNVHHRPRPAQAREAERERLAFWCGALRVRVRASKISISCCFVAAAVASPSLRCPSEG